MSTGVEDPRYAPVYAKNRLVQLLMRIETPPPETAPLVFKSYLESLSLEELAARRDGWLERIDSL